jgi:hypothetical protein
MELAAISALSIAVIVVLVLGLLWIAVLLRIKRNVDRY